MLAFSQTTSCHRLPQRDGGGIDRSFLTCSTSASSAAVNRCWTTSIQALTFRNYYIHYLLTFALSLFHFPLSLAILLRILANPVSNVFQKQLADRSASPIVIIGMTHL
jgi:hypothetical protein